MENLKLKVLNGNAKLLAQQGELELVDIDILVEGVMDHILTTGTTAIDFENLQVRVCFIEGSIKEFNISNGFGTTVDIQQYAGKFKKALILNRRKGLQRLTKEILDHDTTSKQQGLMVFGKN